MTKDDNPIGFEGDKLLEGDISNKPEGDIVFPEGSNTIKKKVKLRNTRTKSFHQTSCLRVSLIR